MNILFITDELPRDPVCHRTYERMKPDVPATGPPSLAVTVAAGARARLAAAHAFLDACPPAAEALVVAASREAADELVRERSAARGATFGLHRFSFWQLASRAASLELARAGLAPATRLGAEAVAARVTFDAREAGALAYLTPVAGFRGFPRALAATLADLRLGAVDPAALEALGDPGRDLRELATRYDAELARARIADRAALLAAAARAVRSGRAGIGVDRPLVLLDVAVESAAEADLVAALVAAAPRAMATVPAGDERTLAALGALAGVASVVEVAAGGEAEGEEEDPPDLVRLRRNLFALDESTYVVPGFSPAPEAGLKASTTYRARQHHLLLRAR